MSPHYFAQNPIEANGHRRKPVHSEMLSWYARVGQCPLRDLSNACRQQRLGYSIQDHAINVLAVTGNQKP